MRKSFDTFTDFINFLNESSKDGSLCIHEYTEIYDAVEDCMAHSEAIEYGHGELTGIVYSMDDDGWEFTVTYTYPDGKTFEIKKEQVW